MAKFNDYRKAPRKPVDRPAWIDFRDGSALFSCVIANASVGGAQLILGSQRKMPDNFALRFSQSAKTHRDCIVRWQSDLVVGIKYASSKAIHDNERK